MESLNLKEQNKEKNKSPQMEIEENTTMNKVDQITPKSENKKIVLEETSPVTSKFPLIKKLQKLQ